MLKAIELLESAYDLAYLNDQKRIAVLESRGVPTIASFQAPQGPHERLFILLTNGSMGLSLDDFGKGSRSKGLSELIPGIIPALLKLREGEVSERTIMQVLRKNGINTDRLQESKPNLVGAISQILRPEARTLDRRKFIQLAAGGLTVTALGGLAAYHLRSRSPKELFEEGDRQIELGLKADEVSDQLTARSHYDIAVEKLNEALRLDPSHSRWWLRLGDAHYFRGDDESFVIKANLGAIAADPNDALAHSNLYKAFLRQGTLAEKETHHIYEDLASKYKSNAPVFFYFGKLHFELGMLELKEDEAFQLFSEAEGLFRKSIQFQDSNPEAWRSLGDAIFSQPIETPERAQELLRVNLKAMRLDPGNPENWKHLGLAYQFSEQHSIAVNTLVHAAQLSPNDFMIWKALEHSYKELGDSQKEKATDAGRRAKELEEQFGAEPPARQEARGLKITLVSKLSLEQRLAEYQSSFQLPMIVGTRWRRLVTPDEAAFFNQDFVSVAQGERRTDLNGESYIIPVRVYEKMETWADLSPDYERSGYFIVKRKDQELMLEDFIPLPSLVVGMGKSEKYRTSQMVYGPKDMVSMIGSDVAEKLPVQFRRLTGKEISKTGFNLQIPDSLDFQKISESKPGLIKLDWHSHFESSAYFDRPSPEDHRSAEGVSALYWVGRLSPETPGRLIVYDKTEGNAKTDTRPEGRAFTLQELAEAERVVEQIFIDAGLTEPQAGFVRWQVQNDVNAEAFFQVLRDKMIRLAAERGVAELGLTQDQFDQATFFLNGPVLQEIKNRHRSLAIFLDMPGDEIILSQVLSGSALKDTIGLALVHNRMDESHLKVPGLRLQFVANAPQRELPAHDNGKKVPAFTREVVKSKIAYPIKQRGESLQGQETLNIFGLNFDLVVGLLLSDMDEVTSAEEIKDPANSQKIREALIKKLFLQKADEIPEDVLDQINKNISFDRDGILIDRVLFKVMIEYMAKRAAQVAA